MLDSWSWPSLTRPKDLGRPGESLCWIHGRGHLLPVHISSYFLFEFLLFLPFLLFLLFLPFFFVLVLVVQSKIATRMIQLSPIAVLAVLSDTRGHGPCVDPASRRREESAHIHAAVAFSLNRRASAFAVPRGGECVLAQVMRAQVSKACASIERVVW